jgi:hypothetical protein
MSRRKDNIQIDLTEVVYEDMEWTQLAQNMVQRQSILAQKAGNFLNK